MQKILGYMRKAIQQYDMINNGDHIGVGVSGGKDSMILLIGLYQLKKFIGIEFEITAITIDPYFGGTAGDYSEISNLCNNIGIQHYILPTHIGEIVFDIRNEKNPCSLCAHMRRGALHGCAGKLSCTKIALGHNFDDTVETFIMNLFTEGRIGCYSPVTVLEDKNLTVIRPLVLAPEKDIRRASKNLPIMKSACPADGHTNRQQTKELIARLEHEKHGIKQRIFGAIQRSGIDGWGIK
ncbi:MAG: tRNA 2-thiocytidine(32) synthetase TtcA [Ruminococcus sp.]|nr:tRNA 2-thiocytidine(32) synthetase TtcA [Ruminococcus sp.]MDE7226371.1 tRNA 2-thiocytidine(32) synthetase TtcA [Ruminococcus sp.]